MSNQPAKEKLSPVRLMIVLLSLALLALFGARYVSTLSAAVGSGATSTWFAPYVDVTLTPLMHFEDPVEQPSDQVVLGFVVADPLQPCLPSWGAYYSLEAAARALDLDRRIVGLRERGGNVVVSFGGASNHELAVACEDVEKLIDAYQTVISRYHLQRVDFDIEGAALADHEANKRRAEAMRHLQQHNEKLEIWLTLPVAPHGMSADATALVDEVLRAEVDLAGVNLMTMNYGGSRPDDMSMQEATEAALSATNEQLEAAYLRAGKPKSDRELWQLMGATPMIGQNDLLSDVFTIEDAHALVAFAQSSALGRLSFWSVNRDVSCGPGPDTDRVSNTCSGVAQDPREFTHIFANGLNRPSLLSAFTGTQSDAETSTDTLAAGASPALDDPRTSPYPLWRSERAYEMGSKVVWQGRVYQAKWWSEGEQPDAPVENVWETPWRYLGPVLESDLEALREAPMLSGNWERWSAEKVFLQGDEVVYNDQVFRAKWWTQGDTPQEYPDQPYDHPWEFLGDANCTADNADSCRRNEGATKLFVDYEGLTGVHLEIRDDDDVEGTAGRLLQQFSAQSGQKTYEVLPGSYDLVFKMAATELTIDAVDCNDSRCDAGDVVADLTVDYAGLTGIEIEIRVDDGATGTAGDLVQGHSGQGGQRSYSVLRGTYDLVFASGATELVFDSVPCDSDSCQVSEISAILSVDYDRLKDVDIEIRHADGIEGAVGGLVQQHTEQRGHRSYSVLRGSYDLVFARGEDVLVVDDLDCSEALCGKPMEVSLRE